MGSIGEVDLKTSEDMNMKHEDGTIRICIQTNGKSSAGFFSVTYNVKIDVHSDSMMNPFKVCPYRGQTRVFSAA